LRPRSLAYYFTRGWRTSRSRQFFPAQANRNVFLAHDPSHGFSATNQKVFLAHDPSHGFSATNQNVSSSADDPNDQFLSVAALPVDFFSSAASRRENGERYGEEISIGSSGSDYYQI